jgi:RNA polymerase sigma factor (sigma-70 family)
MQSLSPLIGRPLARPPAVAYRVVPDARLARLAAAGHDGAMAAIFERHHAPLHRYCHSIVGNTHDASDALQNTMMRALRSLPGETREIALRPWLYRIAHNESISLLRTRRADCGLDAAASLSDAASTGAAESRERLRSLTDDLRELSERQRGALLMRELAGLTFEEVAQALDMSAAGVKQCVYEARCSLQIMEEGRSMNCDAVRRTLSDGDRRVSRGRRLRGHLRDCAGCRDFAAATSRRPEQLAAGIPALPAGAAATMLQGLVGGAGASAGGGGIAAGLIEAAKVTTGFSLGANAAAVVAVSATLAGGAALVLPAPDGSSAGRGASPVHGHPLRASLSSFVLGASSIADRGGAAGTDSGVHRPAATSGHGPAAAPQPASGGPATTSGRSDPEPAAGSGGSDADADAASAHANGADEATAPAAEDTPKDKPDPETAAGAVKPPKPVAVKDKPVHTVNPNANANAVSHGNAPASPPGGGQPATAGQGGSVAKPDKLKPVKPADEALAAEPATVSTAPADSAASPARESAMSAPAGNGHAADAVHPRGGPAAAETP